MDRLNETLRTHLKISDTITSSISSLSLSRIKMIPGLPLNGLNLRSYIPDPIQPLILLSYPLTMGHSSSGLQEGGMSSVTSQGTVGYWGETIEKRLGSSSILGSTLARHSAVRTKLVELAQNIPLLDKVVGSTWLRQASSPSIPSSTKTAITSQISRAYGKGPKDALFVLFWAIAFTILRELTMRFVFEPLMRLRLKQLDARRTKKSENSRSVNGKQGNGSDPMTPSRKRDLRLREKTVTRFAEQGWMFSYCVTFFSLGVYILSRTDRWPFSSAYLWKDYPHTPLSRLRKFYYLAQLGFWFHQVFVINIEQRRKDHWQMYTHHIITITLVAGSYWTNYTRVGGVIMVLMDFCDILLPLAKMFRYFGLSTLTDATFVIFLLSWLVTRQIGFFAVLLSCVLRAPHKLPWSWDPSQGLYVNQYIIGGFSVLLAALLVMSCIWFYMACNVAYRVICGLGAEDSRSDDEGLEMEGSDEDQVTIKATHCSSSIDTSSSPNGSTEMQSCSQRQSVREYPPGIQDAVGQSVRKRH